MAVGQLKQKQLDFRESSQELFLVILLNPLNTESKLFQSHFQEFAETRFSLAPPKS